MTIKHFGDEVAFNIPKPRRLTPATVAGTEQDVFGVLNALHTQTVDALPEDNPLVGLLSRALDEALVLCPNLRLP